MAPAYTDLGYKKTGPAFGAGENLSVSQKFFALS